jgi:hypothetical protein
MIWTGIAVCVCLWVLFLIVRSNVSAQTSRRRALATYGSRYYTFEPRWKEEMICVNEGGKFILYYAMGIPTVYLPPETEWASVAPDWAKDHWNALHPRLIAWCGENRTDLKIQSDASVWPYWEKPAR